MFLVIVRDTLGDSKVLIKILNYQNYQNSDGCLLVSVLLFQGQVGFNLRLFLNAK
jgi:hypothetical protein